MDYKVSMKLVYGKDKFNEPFQSKRLLGDFRVTKHFTVTNVADRKDKPNGYVVQFVKKTTEVTHKCGAKWNTTTKEQSECDDGAPETQLSTSEEIEALTAGNVKYMTHSYLELFVIKGGESTSDDAFQNGAVAKYEWVLVDEDKPDGLKHWEPIIEDDDEKFFTKGRIVMQGTSIFINKASNIRSAYPWTRSKRTPANGLLYLEATDEILENIWAKRLSEPLVHRLIIEWDYPTSEKGNKTQVTVESPVRGRSASSANSFSLSPRSTGVAASPSKKRIRTLMSPIFKNERGKTRRVSSAAKRTTTRTMRRSARIAALGSRAPAAPLFPSASPRSLGPDGLSAIAEASVEENE